MILVTLDRVSVTYGAGPVFESLSWEIPGDRVVGLIGPNGCGKSTLLRLSAGEQHPQVGRVIPRRDLRIGFLAQDPDLTPGRTLLEEVSQASPERKRVEADLAAVEARLGEPAVYGNENALARALARQEKLLEEFTRLGGDGFQGQVVAILRSLGFVDDDLQTRTENLSGGQKKLAGLARLLIHQPGLLLLDEPDNHLDLESKAYLENLIRSYKGGVVIVSHDRYLLDLVVDEIVELEAGRLTTYPGNYSEYAFEKQARLLRQQQLFQAQQKEISRLEQSAKRLMTWGKIYDNEKFSNRGKAMLKRLEKMEKIEGPNLDARRMGLDLKGWRGSNKVLEINNLTKGFPISENHEPVSEAGTPAVLSELNLLVWHGERLGLVGPNGSGKSLLIRLILGAERADRGEIILGPSVSVGYYAQEHETLDPGRSLIATVRRAAPLSEESAVSFLGRFLFSYDQARGLVGDLSGGERSRLQLALLMLSGANFLLLDEPTNNLDIPSAEVLEEALSDFEGTLFVISHDRYFLDRVVTRIELLEGGRLQEYDGNFSDYLGASVDAGEKT